MTELPTEKKKSAFLGELEVEFVHVHFVAFVKFRVEIQGERDFPWCMM